MTFLLVFKTKLTFFIATKTIVTRPQLVAVPLSQSTPYPKHLTVWRLGSRNYVEVRGGASFMQHCVKQLQYIELRGDSFIRAKILSEGLSKLHLVSLVFGGLGGCKDNSVPVQACSYLEVLAW